MLQSHRHGGCGDAAAQAEHRKTWITFLMMENILRGFVVRETEREGTERERQRERDRERDRDREREKGDRESERDRER